MTPFMQTIVCQAFADEATELSLHTDDPGDAGDNELSGGSYAREPLTWGTASAGMVTAAPVAFLVPPDTVVAYLGFWNATGDFLESKLVDLEFDSGGSYGPQVRFDQLAG